MKSYLDVPRYFDPKKPRSLLNQHKGCPSWWGLLSDDDLFVCCAICHLLLGEAKKVGGES